MFTDYKTWSKNRYGDPLFRVPVQLATSCPHGRCAFCSENGSRAQQAQHQESPFDQIEEAIRFSKRRYKAQKLMLYIQAFTADLTHPDQQNLILNCLEKYNFEAISIGTRPDCLPKKALHFLENLSKTVEVWVELGVQTANNSTLETIHRGHDWECSRQAILDLTKRGIHVAPHIILGLPDETSTDWNRTAEELAKLPLSGIKLHNLHIIRGTQLAAQYAAAPFPLLNHWEYAEGLIDFLRRIPAELPVMRISTDTPDAQLIAPHWHLEKGQFLDYILQQMKCRQIAQGDWAQTGNLKLEMGMEPIQTEDGSITFFSEDWKEHYHTQVGARLEADKKFIEPSGLIERLQTGDVRILDVCFGLGNNSLAALCAQSRTGFQPVTHSLDITALEMDKRIVRAAAENFQSLKTDPVDWNAVLHELLDQSTFHNPHSIIHLALGDARWRIQNLPDDSFDVVFHDPFSSQHCPELWTVEFFKQLLRVIKPNGVLLTYSSSQPVRGAMSEAGFHLAETEPGHRMGNGTIASRQSKTLTGFPTIGKLDERRSIPYRDPFLCATSKAILRQRQEYIEITPSASPAAP